LKKISAIFGCAFIGSALRFLLTPPGAGHHLMTIMVINIVGCFLLPVITWALPLLVPISPVWVTGLSVGLVGSFTTFSTFTLDALKLLQHHSYGLAAGYVLGSLILGWGAAAFSIWLTKRWLQEDRDL